MTISRFQNTGNPKWRVTLKVDNREYQKYFPYTDEGYKDAVRCEKKLKREQEAGRALGASRMQHEHDYKLFKTGVCNVRLGCDHHGYPFFAVMIGRPYSPEFSMHRSINKWGYEGAWNEVMTGLFKHLKKKDPIPPPPPYREAKKHLKAFYGVGI